MTGKIVQSVCSFCGRIYDPEVFIMKVKAISPVCQRQKHTINFTHTFFHFHLVFYAISVLKIKTHKRGIKYESWVNKQRGRGLLKTVKGRRGDATRKMTLKKSVKRVSSLCVLIVVY